MKLKIAEIQTAEIKECLYIQLDGNFSLENISPQCALICITSNNAEKVIKLLYNIRDLRNHDTVHCLEVQETFKKIVLSFRILE